MRGGAMANTNQDDREIAEGMRRLGNADYLSSHIKEPLKVTITSLLGKDAILFSAAIDLILPLIFTHIDLLGYLYKGENKSVHAVEFIRVYLGRVDQRYKEVGGLLYHALRHGMVHLATPKRIKLKDGRMLDFSFQRSGQRKDYLKITRYPEESVPSPIIYIYRLSLDILLLYQDLLSAIDEYAKDIGVNHELSDVFTEAFIARRKPEEEQGLPKEYNQDLDFIYDLLG
jgi:hypothetical protein